MKWWKRAQASAKASAKASATKTKATSVQVVTAMPIASVLDKELGEYMDERRKTSMNEAMTMPHVVYLSPHDTNKLQRYQADGFEVVDASKAYWMLIAKKRMTKHKFENVKMARIKNGEETFTVTFGQCDKDMDKDTITRQVDRVSSLTGSALPFIPSITLVRNGMETYVANGASLQIAFDVAGSTN